MKNILITGATIYPVVPRKMVIESGEILINSSGEILKVQAGNTLKKRLTSDSNTEILDLSGKVILPGFVQTHVHLCQTLFRNWADDLELLNWLKKRIWPLEAHHTSESMELSARIGCREMFMSGTTTINDMASVRHTEKIFMAAKDEGIRAIIGKCLMDSKFNPQYLKENTNAALQEAMDLYEKWNLHKTNLLQVSLAPRFALSCTDELMKEVAKLSQSYQIPIHTHASENKKEVSLVKKLTGRGNIAYLKKMGLLGKKTVLAHCIHISQSDIKTLNTTGSHVAHCPSSNMKLSSGIAPVVKLLKNKVNVSIGTDGAPCNNNHDMFNEMKLTGNCQNLSAGAGSLKSEKIIEMATINGAKALGLEKLIGSIEPGKKADLIALDLDKIHSLAAGKSYKEISSSIVYSATGNNLIWTMVNGKIRYINGNSKFHKRNDELVKEAKKLTPYFSSSL